MLKTFLHLLLIGIIAFSCGKTTEPDSNGGTGTSTGAGSGSGSTGGCGTYNGHQLHKGTDGGCYYINSSGNKTYVERSKCNC